MMVSNGDVTELLRAWGDGDRSALDLLVPQVYAKLRQLARAQLRRERPGHTLQPTALVHESFLRLVNQDRIQWKNRAQFCAMAAQMMRRILVDHARQHRAAKRGSGDARVTFDEAMDVADQPPDVDVLLLDEVLERLAKLDPRQSEVVVLRFFGGLSIDEVAVAMGRSPATVKRDWATARLWLHRELAGQREA